MNPRINKLVDFAERVGWTAVYFAAAEFINWSTSGGPWSWRVFLIGVGLAAAKVVTAQNIGRSSDGALPSAVEPPPKPGD